MPIRPDLEESAEVVLQAKVWMHAQADALRVADLGNGGFGGVSAEIPQPGPPDWGLLVDGHGRHKALQLGLWGLLQERLWGGVETLGGLGEGDGLREGLGLSFSIADQGLACGQQLAMEPLLEISFSQNLVLFLQHQRARDS